MKRERFNNLIKKYNHAVNNYRIDNRIDIAIKNRLMNINHLTELNSIKVSNPYIEQFKKTIKDKIKIENYIIKYGKDLFSHKKNLITLSNTYDVDRYSCLDNNYVKNVLINVNNRIDECGLGQQFKNNFTSILNASVKTGNPVKVLKTAIQVKKIMQKYIPLARGRNVGQICQYALAVITQGISNVDTLHDVNPTHQGYNLFNFMVHQYDYAIQYYDNIKNIIKKRLSYKKNIKANKPILYEPWNIQIHYALINFIKNHANYKNNKKVNDIEAGAINISWFLSQLNLVFNTYLEKVGLLKLDSHHNYKLTSSGIRIVKHPNHILRLFFKHNIFSYVPDVPLSKIIRPILNNLNWVYKHPKDNHYYGLIFAQGIINYNRYQEICNYTDAQGNARTLALSPFTYTIIILAIINYIAIKTNHKNAKKIKLPATANCLKQLEQLDSVAKRMVK